MRTNTFFYCLLAMFLLASGCATGLPNVKDVVNDTQADGPPKIVTPGGQLSPKQSREVIRKLEEEAGPTDILKRQIKLIETISGNKLVSGNKATLLVDGPATYGAMFKAIRDARDSINLETFIFDDDETGQKFADLLLKKRAEGVQVNIIYDSVGSVGTPAAFFQRLKDGGVQTLEFNPVNPLKVRRKWRINHRDHRKILVVDGRVAFTGGINISSVYTSRMSPGHQE
jgi:cardiolipin synthase